MTEGEARVAAVLTGRAVPHAWPSARSAVAKQPREGRLAVGRLGLEGDEQGDPRHHGGPEKAVHVYALGHYRAWLAELAGYRAALAVLTAPGAFGENLAVTGLDEATVCIGDAWRFGSALLEVSQARQPCWKLDDRFGVPGMARRVQQTGRTGWYCRVLEPGEVAADARPRLERRPHPGWPLTRLVGLLFHDMLDPAALAEAAALPELAERARDLFARRLATGAIEDWAPRLDGPRGAAA
ncbi:MOSC domain-containing protein [Roseomonas sp. HF4]|uniref:MOSC domain-containing protein n=1 Tax=Roseomonas sp. HF4 TaxID=2562313 RepID=UPI0010C0F542|nr:MOSC domain-containing protein [Roseomonas sp. HF4]